MTAIVQPRAEGTRRPLSLKSTARLCDVLSHLYVLIPVLDARKHYFIGDDELEKLLARGEGWLQAHPEREPIVTRDLKRQPRARSPCPAHARRGR